MSLFAVNRYENEEWKEDADSSHDHLSALLQKIEERKRQKAASKVVDEPKDENVPERANECDDEAPEIKLSKRQIKKKRKREQLMNAQVDKEDNEEEEKVSSSAQVISETTQANFTILGQKKRLKSQSVKRVLPHWLTHPEIVSSNLNSGSDFDEVESLLDPRLIDKLKDDGLKKLFPIQVHLLSWLLKCDKDYNSGKWVRDSCVCMPTGSGKTLAYVLPIIQVLRKSFVRTVRCLIVLPVQELSSQVYEVVAKYANCVSLKVALISGAASFKEEQDLLVQKNDKGEFCSLADVVVATPGRLIDHVRKTPGFSLSNLRYLVIDEADCATEWLQYIPFPHSKAPPLTISNVRSSLNKPAQKVLLSATLSQDPEKLSRLGLFRPILFSSLAVDFDMEKDLNLDEGPADRVYDSRYGNPGELTERIVQSCPEYKPLALYKELVKIDEVVERSLVFTNSSESAHRLAILLRSLLKDKEASVAELSAQLGSKQREETLDKFVQGKHRVLVSSDALARGLDIPGVKLVVSYDLPKHVKGYIHRAGRTGRGGVPGTAVSILLPNQLELFAKMLRRLGRSVPPSEPEDLEKLAESLGYESHLENLKKRLADEQEASLRRSKCHKPGPKA